MGKYYIQIGPEHLDSGDKNIEKRQKNFTDEAQKKLPDIFMDRRGFLMLVGDDEKEMKKAEKQLTKLHIKHFGKDTGECYEFQRFDD